MNDGTAHLLLKGHNTCRLNKDISSVGIALVHCSSDGKSTITTLLLILSLVIKLKKEYYHW